MEADEGCCESERRMLCRNNLVMQGLHAFLIWSYTRDTVLFVGPLYSEGCQGARKASVARLPLSMVLCTSRV